MYTDNFGPAVEARKGQWRFPEMMSVHTFGTVMVGADTEAEAREGVAEMVRKGDWCRKRTDDSGVTFR